jgi:excisionase family DNA binding protein
MPDDQPRHPVQRVVNPLHVTVPDPVAGELLRLLLLGLRVKADRTGAVATAELVGLLHALHAAERRHTYGHPAPTAAIGSTPPAAPILGEQEMTVSDAAEVMGCSATWVRVLVRSGRLTARRAGRRTWLVDRRSLDAYRYGKRPT